ncbi:ABC-2 type transport system ATP-binding protein [Streptomyces sp. OV198]|jgi:ABC-2 type transport system ATP-binding protein|uniref:ABC transporter ATP-binding protein n=1 Tax=unclassified Streptomyces TaxID=2593676 RepID=UPI000BB1109D|nr:MULTISPECIES: ABC transporter ATP-binding protein [unclassified Streptomyces]PBD00524.1 ABC-2 type transport system ATP-binding protein [Streptomyces sp. Ag82_O1-15]SOE77332.1 ABC-2 type transport system ATP-binding protein [Streptomyces sp. OV198]
MTTHANELAVDVRGLRKQYGDVTAVDGIDLGIRRGEVFGLLGPNGAGKSTTVEILQGNRGRDAGEVSVLGADPATGTRAWRSRVGIVWQDESAPAELTVDETVRHFARYYPRPRDPEEVIGLVGLEAKAGSRIKALSGGQRRRLDVALGVIGGPELLLLDEPTTGFDPAARRQFWDLIRKLADEGTTILLTTHYLEEAEALAHRLAIVARGRVVAEGEPTALRERFGTEATVEWTEADGTTRSERTDTPTRTVAELTRRFDGEIPGLSVTRPTLEDVYLRLTGQENAR